MPKPDLNLRTQAFVLRRLKYHEADRIVTLLTPEGKIACVAKGVRKPNSKLAGGIEMFTLNQVIIHRNSKSLQLLTSARMEFFYREVAHDLERLELASNFIRQISRITEQIDTPEYFDLLKQSLDALNGPEKRLLLIETWFNFNFARIQGEQINLLTDTSGSPLKPDETYTWDSTEKALKPLINGKIGANEIKIMRLMLSSQLALVARVKNLDAYLDEIHYISKSVI